MAEKRTNMSVQIMDQYEGDKLNLFPTTFAHNVIITEDPEVTLEDWLNTQDSLNSRFEKATQKINAYVQECLPYEYNRLVPERVNPYGHSLWARPVEYISEDAILGDGSTYIINVFNSEISSANIGQIYTTDIMGNNTSKATYLPVVKSDPQWADEGGCWLLDPDYTGSIEEDGLILTNIEIREVNPITPTLGQVWIKQYYDTV